MPFSAGDTVWLKARVTACYHEDRGPEWETYDLRLNDGQQVQTNVKNLEEAGEDGSKRQAPGSKGQSPNPEPGARSLERPTPKEK